MKMREATAARPRTSVLIIKLEGEFDLADCDRLSDAFSVSTAAQFVVIDFRNATYIDSSILRCLFSFRKNAFERGIRLALAGVTGSVKHVIEICRFDRLFDMRTSLNDCVGSSATAYADIRTLTLVSRAGA